jgi:hypothetical protein
LISQAVNCPKRTEPRGELATQTGVWLAVAAVVLAMPSGSQSAGGRTFGQPGPLGGGLQTAENAVLSTFGRVETLHRHALASLHCSAIFSRLLSTCCAQKASWAAGVLASPHPRNSFTYFLGVYLTTRLGGLPKVLASNGNATRWPFEPVMTNAIALSGV